LIDDRPIIVIVLSSRGHFVTDSGSKNNFKKIRAFYPELVGVGEKVCATGKFLVKKESEEFKIWSREGGKKSISASSLNLIISFLISIIFHRNI